MTYYQLFIFFIHYFPSTTLSPHAFSNPSKISTVNYQYPFLLMRHIGALLALEDDGTWLQGFHGVPDILPHVHAVAAFRWVEDNVFNDGAVVVVGDDTYPATQHNK